MARILILVLFSFVFSFQASAQKDLQFTCLDSVFAYAGKNSSVSKTDAQQVILARFGKLASYLNILNLRNPLTFNLTDNTALPVSFIPANLLGGPPGKFKEITLGQQYLGNFTVAPQIDIINAGAWSRIRTATLNEELTTEQNSINTKTLFESIAACYYNILSFQEQLVMIQSNLTATDTLLGIVTGKFNQGLVRQQDVNDVNVNKLSLTDKEQELELSLEQQYNSLILLCDAPAGTKLVIQEKLGYEASFPSSMTANSQLLFKASVLQTELARADMRTNRLMNSPVVSLVYANSYYQNSNDRFFDYGPGEQWLNSVYFGAKVTWNLPDVNQLVAARNSKINYSIAEINLEHNKVQDEVSNAQLQLDYQKAWSAVNSAKQIYQLKDQNYSMARNQYDQQILPFDKLLLAFNEQVNNHLNYNSALANLLYVKSKIDLNNKLK